MLDSHLDEEFDADALVDPGELIDNIGDIKDCFHE